MVFVAICYCFYHNSTVSVASIVTKYHYNYQANITSKHKTTIGQELEENWTIAHDLFEDVNGA